MAPIAASTQAKTKLKAFQFIEGRPERRLTNADKENVENIALDVTDEKVTVPLPTETKQVLETPKITQSKAFLPSTPATRLPLADLIGNADDSNKRNTALAKTPEEHLLWVTNLGGSQKRAVAPERRNKKRARSSSPLSSQQEKETLDLNNLHQSLKTPQADPAADLWSTYAGNANGHDIAAEGINVAFAHLIETSSPHSSATAGSVGGLRRWASCGVEWPTSNKKRRRTTGVFREQKNNTLVGSDELPKKSRIGLLVEQLEGLAKPTRQAVPNAPSSSSPLREPNGLREDPHGSPLQRLAPIDEDLEEPRLQPESPQRNKAASQARRTAVLSPASSSSEFGDGDIDMDTLVEIESTLRTIAPEKAHTEATEKPAALPSSQAYELPPPPQINSAIEPSKHCASTHIDDDFDDFGDDEDLFAADLEQVASLYDTRPDFTASHPDSGAATHVLSPKRNSKSKNPPPLPPPPLQPNQVINLDASDDEFGDDDIDVEQFAAAEIAATQACNGNFSTPPNARNRAIQRYFVTRVVESDCTVEGGHTRPEKVLLVEDEKDKTPKAITLRQAWFDTPCTEGSYIHIIGEFTRTGQCTIDNKHNIIILHPDHLISATVVADSFSCMRRAVLQDRVKATSQASAPTMYGNILHQLFQEAIRANSWDTEFLERLIQNIVPLHYETIAEIELNLNQVNDHLRSKLPEIQAWAEIFVRAEPGSTSKVKDRNGKSISMSINKLLDVEEHVWSPTFGMKGNIDATVQVHMEDDEGTRTLTVPLEIKTGKRTSENHRAQTALYTLLLSDRYDVDIACGILYYLETSELIRIPAVRHELLHMIIKRNELACYVRERLQLPPMLKDDHKCGKCYAQQACFLYHKLAEDGDDTHVRAKDQFNQLVKYLKPEHQEFFKNWDRLLTKEESEMMKFRRELWTMLSTEREKLGRCFSNVVIEPDSALQLDDGGKINRFQYTLIKQTPRSGFSFTESQITVGEPIVISDEQGHFALANGYVTNVRKRNITVAVDRCLHNARTKGRNFHAESNQTFAGIMDVQGQATPASTVPIEEPLCYRLDKDEFSNGMATVRNNIIQIMDDNVYKASELRSLVIEHKAPSFRPVAFTTAPSTHMEMNADQTAAVEKVMSAQNYALVLGMPGTGKTTTIAHIIRALVAKGKSVLLTSYTHTAVDNILLKVRNAGFDVLRLGALAKVHPEVKEFAILGAEPKPSLEQLKDSWYKPPVVATTCLGVNHPLFSHRIFDYCIVDEASQITLPVCLGPIRMAKTFVLVGDHFQLPPLVQNEEAREGGLDVSLFRMLCEKHPEAVVSLEHQYRMCADIMLLANRLIYSGRLKCGNDAVANRQLNIPDINGLSKHHHNYLATPSKLARTNTLRCPGPSHPPCILNQILIPSNHTLFLSTDGIPSASETVSGPRITNMLEIHLLVQTILSLLSTGVAPQDIGIITFYRSQLALIKQCLRHFSPSHFSPTGSGNGSQIEAHTADKFQGRDKEVVLVSFVRSTTPDADGALPEVCNVGDLLKDWRRINVAVTRARSKLVMVGSKRTLARSGSETLKGLVELCEEKGWIRDLETGDLEGHVFEEGWVSQTQTQGAWETPLKKSPASSPRKRPTPAPTKVAGNSPPGRRKVLGEAGGPGKKSPRKVFGEIDAPNVSPSRKATQIGAPKAPEKRALAGRKVLDQRAVLRDLMNDVL